MSQQNFQPVPDGRLTAAYPRTEDEIDLIELFQTIWSQKAKIALVTLVTTLAAGVYAFTAEEVWTSKAVFDQPKL
ncbi:MAG: Wzz/FepE/Etk N-terminal domain-containing protein, partial [Aeromonadaceae bacterium]